MAKLINKYKCKYCGEKMIFAFSRNQNEFGDNYFAYYLCKSCGSHGPSKAFGGDWSNMTKDEAKIHVDQMMENGSRKFSSK